MHESPYHPSQWKHLIPDIDALIAKLERSPIMAVGITPYIRIIPSFFLKNYSVYAVRSSSDTDVLKDRISIHVLGDHNPKAAERIHGTNYLLGNYAFHSFYKSRKVQPTLLLNTVNEKTLEQLEKLGAKWIGNRPETYKSVMHKGPFRELIRERGLPYLHSHTISRASFLESRFEDLREKLEGPFVVQRADKEVGGNEGTFFVHDADDFRRCLHALSKDETFNYVVLTGFVEGYSTSMLGCVMPEGVLSGPLQLQLIDVPESLNGVAPNGIFFGNDLGFHPWGDDIEQQAQEVVESIGQHLREEGYRGIFGIDFLYDKARRQLFPNECNPRCPGSLTLYSLMLLESGAPPLEFFDLLAHLDISCSLDFDAINKALKVRKHYSHIAFSPKGILSMQLPLAAGVYSYDAASHALEYVRPGISLADIRSENEFLIIDTVPKIGTQLEQNVPRFFKFIFPRSIARSSYEVDREAGFLVERFAQTLLEASREKEIPRSPGGDRGTKVN